MLARASDFAGFGYEVALMRKYQALAKEGASWLIVYAPDDAVVDRIVAVARQFEALCAVRYHGFANEDLI